MHLATAVVIQQGVMRDGMMGGWWWGAVLGTAISLLLLAALVLVVIWLYQQVRDGGPSRSGPSASVGTASEEADALELARRRYARGDLTREEFEQIRRDLS